MKTPGQKYRDRKRWREDIKLLQYSMCHLWQCYDIFCETNKVVGRNESIYKPDDTYWVWIKNNFIHHICIGIRRIIDRDNRAVSLHRLLKEMQETPNVITKRALKGCQKGGNNDFVLAYDRFVDKNGKIKSIKSDINKIGHNTNKFRCIKIFTDQWIAHYDRKKSKIKRPSLRDIENAMKVLDQLVCKYLLLNGADKYSTLRWRLPSKWKYPLTIPWNTEN